MTVGAVLDSGCLLVDCDLCGCLVVASALRAWDYYVADRVGVLERATRIVCADAAACYARTPRPDRWTRFGATAPVGCEPEDGALLWTCDLCCGPATADELSISRERDGGGWWEMVRCADEAECEERQRMGTGPPELPG